MPTVVIVNGPSSAGKSSLARALQAAVQRPMLHVEMDSFLAMLPGALQDDERTFRYRITGPAKAPLVQIDTGPLGEKLLAGMWDAALALAGAGFDLTFDIVLSSWRPPDIARHFAPHRVILVRVTAPEAVLAAREAARPDRMAGMARAQMTRVDRGLVHDATVDSSRAAPAAIAADLAARFGL